MFLIIYHNENSNEDKASRPSFVTLLEYYLVVDVMAGNVDYKLSTLAILNNLSHEATLHEASLTLSKVQSVQNGVHRLS